MNNAKKQVITFIILLVVLSTVVYTLYFNGLSHKNLIWLMWCPGIAAIITRLFYQKNLKNFGWGWGKTRYQAAAYFLPLLLGLIVYGIVWGAGLGGVSIENFTNFVAHFLSLPNSLSFIPSFLIIAVAGFIGSAISAFGEEIGWRGLLVPELAKLTSFTKVSIISGVIWALWHYPGILFLGYSSGLPSWFALLCFTVMVISSSFVYTWLRLKSGSVWTGVILHSTHNLFIQVLFDKVTVDTGTTFYFTTEFGVGLAIIYSVAAYICWKKRNELPQN